MRYPAAGMRQDRGVRLYALLTAAALAVTIGSGCGGGDEKNAGGGATGKANRTAPGESNPRSGAPRGHPRFRASLSADTHSPRAEVPWGFVVQAVRRHGRPVAGTAVAQVLKGHQAVDTIGQFGFKGELRRTYNWSSDLQGSPATLQVKVTGPGGARTLRYAVHVRPDVASSPGATGHPGFRASLSADSHTPKPGAAWGFAVHAVGKHGRPSPGTAIVRVVRGNRVVDTVGWFGFKGTLRRRYRWSSELKGSSAVFQVRVVGAGGTRVLRYPVHVRP
jgi:hypothetical protein